MTSTRTLLSTTAIGLSMLANAAYADVTAAEVWGDWRSYMEGMGYVVTASETASGNTLSVNDISVEMKDGPDIEKMTVSMGTLQFVENRDGTVDVVMANTMPITIDIQPKSTDKPTQIALDYTHSGQKMTVSGDVEEMSYDYTADVFGATLKSLLVDGTTMGPEEARFTLEGTDAKSLTKVITAPLRSYEQSAEIGALTYSTQFKEADDVESFAVKTTSKNIVFAGTANIPADMDMQTQDIVPLLTAGLAFAGTFTANSTETEMVLISEEGETNFKTASASSTADVSLGQDGISYDVAAEDIQVGAQIAGLPFPLSAEMVKSGFQLNMPLMKSDDPQDFALAFNATEFKMSDIIWALFDSAGQLPRDPATIALDLSGKAKVLVDALDTETMEAMAENGTKPGELHALRIDRLVVDAVGAKLDATGDVTFDNTDMTTLPGFPKPLGEANINLAGANGLMDKLVAMGFLPAEQAMGARMMMGMFAVPGDAPDTLKSKIEFNEEGQILANGQRFK
ncbi:hypothetical protein GGR95_001969 [Sulfitobacter undariae]|uniref:DUF2125 domain-containing protein n=1 Tax=Sulfitobacter undariae TaxID=1563671 RepID=A0A7W6H215_9RHOB|nr:DUF2125 domain-containing protein [Sulfitobacter undariae]MBB3994324.1 hypothetical protein [Sulfitobacter undariae]